MATVRSKCHSVDTIFIPIQVEDVIPVRGIPDLDQPIPAARGEVLSIGAEGNIVDQRTMTDKLSYKVIGNLRVKIPKNGSGIVTGRGQQGAVGIVGDIFDNVLVTGKYFPVSPGFPIPDHD